MRRSRGRGGEGRRCRRAVREPREETGRNAAGDGDGTGGDTRADVVARARESRSMSFGVGARTSCGICTYNGGRVWSGASVQLHRRADAHGQTPECGQVGRLVGCRWLVGATPRSSSSSSMSCTCILRTSGGAAVGHGGSTCGRQSLSSRRRTSSSRSNTPSVLTPRAASSFLRPRAPIAPISSCRSSRQRRGMATRKIGRGTTPLNATPLNATRLNILVRAVFKIHTQLL